VFFVVCGVAIMWIGVVLTLDALGGILFMRDRRVVEKIDECVRKFTLVVLLRLGTLKIISPELLQVLWP
jgi:hypothetical protein